MEGKVGVWGGEMRRRKEERKRWMEEILMEENRKLPNFDQQRETDVKRRHLATRKEREGGERRTAWVTSWNGRIKV